MPQVYKPMVGGMEERRRQGKTNFEFHFMTLRAAIFKHLSSFNDQEASERKKKGKTRTLTSTFKSVWDQPGRRGKLFLLVLEK